jgi:hypothetical protein
LIELIADDARGVGGASNQAFEKDFPDRSAAFGTHSICHMHRVMWPESPMHPV